jgi:2-keto-4-pentenoate hydratase/2-oxohepta-3-ene-1,7-dioic acid hydratase in catechol pathway
MDYTPIDYTQRYDAHHTPENRMKFLTRRHSSWDEPCVLSNGIVYGLRPAGFDDLVSIVAGGQDALTRIGRFVARCTAGEPLDLDTTPLLSPIPNPGKIICIGLNYRDHAAEARLPIPEVPTVFAKFSNTVVGHRHPIVLPRNSVKPDYEAEFAIVVGEGGRHIAEEDWRDHVFGYTILNDVSARDFQLQTSQWTMGKTFDTFAPIGPVVVTADEIEDPHSLAISLKLNGAVMQNSNTSNMVFGVPKLIAFLSSVMTLSPGDIITTGTPAGVGFAQKPPRWLRPGDEIEIEVEGIGRLVNPVVAES